jgi:phosphoglucosamine mutase
VSALQVLSAIRTSRSTISKLCGGLELYPQELVNVKVPKGFDWQKEPEITRAKEDAERALGRNGRVLLRPSGTEPVLRVMVEGKDDAQVRRLARKIATAVEQAA